MRLETRTKAHHPTCFPALPPRRDPWRGSVGGIPGRCRPASAPREGSTPGPRMHSCSHSALVPNLRWDLCHRGEQEECRAVNSDRWDSHPSEPLVSIMRTFKGVTLACLSLCFLIGGCLPLRAVERIKGKNECAVPSSELGKHRALFGAIGPSPSEICSSHSREQPFTFQKRL